MTSRLAEVGAISLVLVAMTLIVSAPTLRAPSERIFGRETVGRHHDPFTVMAHFSQPIVLDMYTQPLTDVPGALVARVAGQVASYNWVVLLTFPMSGLAAYALGRYLAL